MCFVFCGACPGHGQASTRAVAFFLGRTNSAEGKYMRQPGPCQVPSGSLHPPCSDLPRGAPQPLVWWLAVWRESGCGGGSSSCVHAGVPKCWSPSVSPHPRPPELGLHPPKPQTLLSSQSVQGGGRGGPWGRFPPLHFPRSSCRRFLSVLPLECAALVRGHTWLCFTNTGVFDARWTVTCCS